jgi:hypothetical protein
MVVVAIGFSEALSAAEVTGNLVDTGFKVIAFSRRGRRGALRHSYSCRNFSNFGARTRYKVDPRWSLNCRASSLVQSPKESATQRIGIRPPAAF